VSSIVYPHRISQATPSPLQAEIKRKLPRKNGPRWGREGGKRKFPRKGQSVALVRMWHASPYCREARRLGIFLPSHCILARAI